MGSTNYPRYKRFYSDYPVLEIGNVWTDTSRSGFGRKEQFVVETYELVIERCLQKVTDPGDLVLDPTCGSGTTAVAAERLGRRWITVDTSRVALALARTRLMAAKYAYFLLADSEEGRRKEAEITGSTAGLQAAGAPGLDVRKGFVYERVPHITLKSIANNEEIDEIHARYEKKIRPFIESLSQLSLKGKAESGRLEEWQVPREADPGWSAEAREAHEGLWKLRRERQAEIDASISRRADTERLFDKPYPDPKRIRVTGPFTVESLSPHRVLSTEEERPKSEAPARAESAAGFATTILDNLRKAGVQNTRKDERLKFDRLDPFPGTWIQFAGEFGRKDGEMCKVAVSLGPEHGTVGPKQIQEAAKEATRGIPFDMLLVLGFAFDGRSADVAKQIAPSGMSVEEGFTVGWEEQLGRLPVLLVRMNPDLAIGEELLKKTGSGNLFLVFGEPDVEIRHRAGGKLEIEIRGVDVYDPTTGVVRNSSVDDIACWFVDTNCDEESFFVRHAYFLGAEEPYEKLQRALRSHVDEAAWARLYSTISRPFDLPTTGKIAVKVINHYGDEVLKVYRVGS
jgi:adenine-specific DNA-methyltransferase